MDKEILRFGNIEIKKISFTIIRLLFFRKCRIEKVLVSHKIKTIKNKRLYEKL